MVGFTQKNTHQYQKDPKSGLLYINRYLNEKGINGQGQIVTVIDSLIDFHHAMFNDANSTFEVNTQLDHRKFVYYDYYGSVENLEKEILEDEHGTHVAGTIAGESLCESDDKGNSLFNGNAPKAKLIFFYMLFMDFLNDEIKIMNKYKSRISSNSWDNNGYADTVNFQYGQVSYENPQIVFIFAAGNEYFDGNFTIDDPSGSKNLISVGAADDLLETKRISRFMIDNDHSVFIDAEQLMSLDPFFTGNIGTTNDSDIFVFNAEETNDCDLLQEKKVFLGYATSHDKVDWISKCMLYYAKGVFISTEVEKVKSFVEQSKSSLSQLLT